MHYHLLAKDDILTDETSPININDIAGQLAKINRFSGATSRPYSVAEHSILCASLAMRYGLNKKVQLACLLHDAHEAYLNDVTTPVKQAMRQLTPAGHMSPWDCLEDLHADHLAKQLGIDQGYETLAHIKQIDNIALAHELKTIGPPDHEPWPCTQGIELHDDVCEQLSDPSDWFLNRVANSFLDKYHWLAETHKAA